MAIAHGHNTFVREESLNIAYFPARAAPQTRRHSVIYVLLVLCLTGVLDTTGCVNWYLLLVEGRELALYYTIKWHIIHLVRDRVSG